MSEETKAKISATKISSGFHMPEDAKNKISKALSGANNHNYGKTLPCHVREKISQTLRGTHLSAKTKKKISLRNINRHWWTNGIENRFCENLEEPGWYRGRTYKYNLE